MAIRSGTSLCCTLPGHTPGCICLYSEKDRLLFSGDTVFADGCFGRYDFPGGSRADLTRSLERLSALGVDGLFAGHGQPTEENGSRCIASALRLIKSGYG